MYKPTLLFSVIQQNPQSSERIKRPSHHGNSDDPWAPDAAVPVVSVCHPWLLLRSHVYSSMGVCGQLQLEVPWCDERVGAFYLWNMHPDSWAHVPTPAWSLQRLAALLYIHPVDIHVGVRNRVAAAAVQCLPLGLLTIQVQLHGLDNGWIRLALVLCIAHRGASGHSQHIAAALWRVGWAWPGWRRWKRRKWRRKKRKRSQRSGHECQWLCESGLSESCHFLPSRSLKMYLLFFSLEGVFQLSPFSPISWERDVKIQVWISKKKKKKTAATIRSVVLVPHRWELHFLQ